MTGRCTSCMQHFCLKLLPDCLASLLLVLPVLLLLQLLALVAVDVVNAVQALPARGSAGVTVKSLLRQTSNLVNLF